MIYEKNVWLIRFTVFIAGAVVMSLEIMGSRLLAPVFGDSIFVWGSLIGIVMASLALGYYSGGKIADKYPHYQSFSTIILIAGILIVLIPISSPSVLEFVFISGIGERYGPLLATTILLAAPTTLLGMISPYAIKLVTQSLYSIGGISGGLYSISTAGSIFGTFLTVFLLVPTFGVRSIIFSLGILLVITSLIGLSNIERIFIILILTILVLPSSMYLAGTLSIYTGNIVYQKESPYNSLSVVDYESRGTRTLWLNSLPHSSMFLNGSNNSVFLYTDYFHVAFIFNPDIKKVLFIGGGGFSAPKKFLEDYPDLIIDVVEIDQEVVNTAIKYFNLPENERLNIYVEDGRIFLSKTDKKYDLIILDAYSKTYVQFHLMTKEFFDLVHGHLNHNGIVVSNLISSLIGDTSDLLKAEYITINKVFKNIYLFQTKTQSLSQIQNIILLATSDEKLYTKKEIIEMAIFAPKRENILAEYAESYYDSELIIPNVPILTDDFAPAQNLLNPITGATYEGGESILPRSSLNSLILSVLWVLPILSLYLLSIGFREKIRK